MAVANPVLNDQTFRQAAQESGERTGMTVSGTYLIAGFLFILVAVGAVFGWGQVDLVTVPSSGRLGGRTLVPVAPDWVGLLTLLTFIIAMVTAFTPRVATWTGPLYAL